MLTIVSGVNMPDHADLFQDLKKKIKDFISPHVVTLQASDCSSEFVIIG